MPPLTIGAAAMKIYNTRPSMFAYVDTDRGEFRVWQHGAIDQYHDYGSHGEWGWFDELKFEEDEVNELRLAGLAAIKAMKEGV